MTGVEMNVRQDFKTSRHSREGGRTYSRPLRVITRLGATSGKTNSSISE